MIHTNYIVYKITNTTNNKSYIGATKRSVDQRWAEHIKGAERNKDCIKFYYAISKYGEMSWTREILYTSRDRKDAFEREQEYIKLFDSIKNGYNTSKGGDGGSHYWDTLTEEEKIEHNKKISKSRSGKASVKRHSTETKMKQSIGNKKFRAARPGYSPKRRTYVCENVTTGEIYVTENLKVFCLEKELSYDNMLYNCRNSLNSTKDGWSCRIKKKDKENKCQGQ